MKHFEQRIDATTIKVTVEIDGMSATGLVSDFRDIDAKRIELKKVIEKQAAEAFST